jgi:hypothetical protein
LKEILQDAGRAFSVPEGLLEALVSEEHKRLYKLVRSHISEDIEAIFDKYGNTK